MADLDEGKIRELAYTLWELEGQPEGRADEHWEMARLRLMTDAEQGQDPVSLPSEVQQSSAAAEKPFEPVLPGKAVDDEDPDYSPMDGQRATNAQSAAAGALKSS
jgi:hypothetical protein